MYFFYVDESGSRDPSHGTAAHPKDHIYVLLAIGLYERQWRPFELEISRLKLELAHYLSLEGSVHFGLADCEIKSTWLRHAPTRSRYSPFLAALHPDDMERLVDAFYDQLDSRNAVVLASVIDKRELHPGTTHTVMHRWAYELLLERIEHFMRQYHSKHNALIVMDDTNVQLNQFIAMAHAALLRRGNPNMLFPHIVEYPFFTRSELSNGVQLADLLAYNVYRAFRDEDPEYPYFRTVLPKIYRRRETGALAGLKVWPETSPLVDLLERERTGSPSERG
ncbi:MAG: DUF3800 domain-containing protein [Gammaproteobacteria bacterium]|nr:DUF3800 domain-containing protein [Gammaproteobacteria bacterium]